MNSSDDGYPGNWMCIGQACKAVASTFYCSAHSSYFCNSCNEHIYAANSMALTQEFVRICTACENQPAAFTSKTDAAPPTCISCDASASLSNKLAHNNALVPTPPFSSLFCKSSSTYREELPDTMLDIENQITASTTDEADQAETDSWLLLEPDNCDNQTNNGFTYSVELDESFSIVEYNSCTDQYQYQDQNNQQHLYGAHQGDDGSDGIVPVQSSEVEEQEEQGQQQQQQQNVYFNGDYKASKAAFMNTPSSNQIVPGSGISPNATRSDISSSYTRYLQGTTNLVPNFLRFTSMNREAKVLRYREKRKARKFEKKIRYASRKAYAEVRPRVKGKFARKTEMDFEVDEMFSTEDCDYGIVPSY